MNVTTIYLGRINCRGCELYDAEWGCLNLINWIGGTPPNPECYNNPHFPEAIGFIDGKSQ